MFFVVKYNSRPKWKIKTINDFVSITVGLLILRCNEERKEKLSTCKMEPEVGLSLSVNFYRHSIIKELDSRIEIKFDDATYTKIKH